MDRVSKIEARGDLFVLAQWCSAELWLSPRCIKARAIPAATGSLTPKNMPPFQGEYPPLINQPYLIGFFLAVTGVGKKKKREKKGTVFNFMPRRSADWSRGWVIFKGWCNYDSEKNSKSDDECWVESSILSSTLANNPESGNYLMSGFESEQPTQLK